MQLRGYGRRFGALIAGASLLAGSALALGASVVGAQAPPTVPVFRAYGTVTLNGQPAPSGTTVTAQSVSTPGTTCGTGSVTGTSGSYFVDVQSIAGCTGNVVFTVNGQATTAGAVTPPSIQGSPQQVNLTVAAATPSPTPPPPPPAPVTTPPPPPPPATTPSPTPAPVVPAGPPNTGVGPGPGRTGAPAESVPSVAAPVTSAPVAVAGAREGAIAQAPAAAPQLPNTGSGGLLPSQAQSGIAGWALAGLGLALFLVMSSAALAYRRTR